MLIEEIFQGCNNPNVINVTVPGQTDPLENATRIVFVMYNINGDAPITLDSAINPTEITWTSAGAITIRFGNLLTSGTYWVSSKAFDAANPEGQNITHNDRNQLLFVVYPPTIPPP